MLTLIFVYFSKGKGAIPHLQLLINARSDPSGISKRRAVGPGRRAIWNVAGNALERDILADPQEEFKEAAEYSYRDCDISTFVIASHDVLPITRSIVSRKEEPTSGMASCDVQLAPSWNGIGNQLKQTSQCLPVVIRFSCFRATNGPFFIGLNENYVILQWISFRPISVFPVFLVQSVMLGPKASKDTRPSLLRRVGHWHTGEVDNCSCSGPMCRATWRCRSIINSRRFRGIASESARLKVLECPGE